MSKKVLFALANQDQAKSFRQKDILKTKLVSLSQYKLQDINFSDFSGIIFSVYSDQYLLMSLKDKIEIFLKNGGKIFFNGHIFKPFIDGLKEFEPIENIKLPDFTVSQISKHEIYKGVNVKRLSRRKGVAGFFSRGSNPPPKKAKNIMAIKNSTVIVDWEWKIKKGYLYVHSGNDLWACMEKERDNLQIFANIIKYLRSDDE